MNVMIVDDTTEELIHKMLCGEIIEEEGLKLLKKSGFQHLNYETKHGDSECAKCGKCGKEGNRYEGYIEGDNKLIIETDIIYGDICIDCLHHVDNPDHERCCKCDGCIVCGCECETNEDGELND
jgi:hypothetical protein